jgi:hypothetical protein
MAILTESINLGVGRRAAGNAAPTNFLKHRTASPAATAVVGLYERVPM